MGTRRRRSDRSGRGVSRSPGRPGVARREDRRRFWAAIASGRSSEDAALRAGVSPAVGARWFREAGGMPPATLAPAAKPPSGRHLSFADREGIALWRAQGHGVREIARRLGRSASTISRELRRNAATRGGGLDYRATTAQYHRAVARRAGRAASEAGEAGGRRGAAALRAGPAGRRGRRPGRSRGPRAGRALEGPAARAAAGPAMGQGVEPAADRPSPAARLSRRWDDAHQPRGHLPGAVRARPRGAAPRADRLPAHRTGAARAPGAQPRAGQILRRSRDPDRRTPGGSGRSGGAGALGR
jgi:hypothetical protein